jgi:hypothetical protein
VFIQSRLYFQHTVPAPPEVINREDGNCKIRRNVVKHTTHYAAHSESWSHPQPILLTRRKKPAVLHSAVTVARRDATPEVATACAMFCMVKWHMWTRNCLHLGIIASHSSLVASDRKPDPKWTKWRMIAQIESNNKLTFTSLARLFNASNCGFITQLQKLLFAVSQLYLRSCGQWRPYGLGFESRKRHDACIFSSLLITVLLAANSPIWSQPSMHLLEVIYILGRQSVGKCDCHLQMEYTARLIPDVGSWSGTKYKYKLYMYTLWRVCWKPELWSQQRQPLLGGGSVAVTW